MGRYPLALGLLALCSACNLLIEAEPQQCEVTEDCTARGAEFSATECADGFCTEVEQEVRPASGSCSKDTECDASETCSEKKCVNRWACVEAEPASEATGEIAVSVLVASSFGDAVPQVQGKVCRSLDPTCSEPVAQVVSDANGLFHLRLPEGFTGYIEVVHEPFFPILYYFPTPLDSQTPLHNLSLTPAQVIQGLAGAVGAEPNPERGHILLAVTSCLGPAPGVELTAPRADETAIPYYVLNGIPSADQEVTAEEGSGGFLNFPPGNAVVKLSSGKAGEIVSLSLTVRAGFITSVAYNPARLQEAP